MQQKRPLRRESIQWYPARSDLTSGLTHPSHTPRAEDRRGPPRFPQARFRGPQRHLRHAGTSVGVGVRTPWLSLAPDTNPARSCRSLALTERDEQMTLMAPTNNSRPCVQPVHLADSEDAHCNDPDRRSIWKMIWRINQGLDPSADVLVFGRFLIVLSMNS